MIATCPGNLIPTLRNRLNESIDLIQLYPQSFIVLNPRPSFFILHLPSFLAFFCPTALTWVLGAQ